MFFKRLKNRVREIGDFWYGRGYFTDEQILKITDYIWKKDKFYAIHLLSGL